MPRGQLEVGPCQASPCFHGPAKTSRSPFIPLNCLPDFCCSHSDVQAARKLDGDYPLFIPCARMGFPLGGEQGPCIVWERPPGDSALSSPCTSAGPRPDSFMACYQGQLGFL